MWMPWMDIAWQCLLLQELICHVQYSIANTRVIKTKHTWWPTCNTLTQQVSYGQVERYTVMVLAHYRTLYAMYDWAEPTGEWLNPNILDDLYFVSSQERPWRHWALPNIHAARRILCASTPVFLFERVRKHTSCTRDDKRLPPEYALMSRSFSRWDKVYL